jgi:hypothetical protein
MHLTGEWSSTRPDGLRMPAPASIFPMPRSESDGWRWWSSRGHSDSLLRLRLTSLTPACDGAYAVATRAF